MRGRSDPEIKQLIAVFLLVDEFHTPAVGPGGEWTVLTIGGGLQKVGDEQRAIAEGFVEVHTVGGRGISVGAEGEASELSGCVAERVPADVHSGVHHVGASGCHHPLAVVVVE